jgi:hypothetical protein
MIFDLTKHLDLTEFNRLVIINEGYGESTYEFLLDDICLIIEISGLMSLKPQRIIISLMDYKLPRCKIQPLSNMRYKHLELFQHIFVYPRAYFGYLTYKNTHEIIKGVEVIVKLLKRNHKLKAFI